MSYPGHSLGASYPSAEKQSVYSTAQADWTKMNKYFYMTLTDTTTLDQSEPGSNANEGVLRIHQTSKIGALGSDAVLCHIHHIRSKGGVLSLSRDD